VFVQVSVGFGDSGAGVAAANLGLVVSVWSAVRLTRWMVRQERGRTRADVGGHARVADWRPPQLFAGNAVPRSRLERTRDGLPGAGRELVVSAAAAVITGQISGTE